MALLQRAASGLCTHAFRRCRQFDSALSCSVISNRFISTTSSRFSRRSYAEKHEWVTVDGKIGIVGISDYAQEALGEVVYVQLPDIGQSIEKDGECGVVESVKAVNEIYSPVGGTVTEVNDNLTDKPKLINESCYEKGWIFKLELTEPKEVDTLMNEESYQKYLKSMH